MKLYLEPECSPRALQERRLDLKLLCSSTHVAVETSDVIISRAIVLIQDLDVELRRDRYVLDIPEFVPYGCKGIHLYGRSRQNISDKVWRMYCLAPDVHKLNAIVQICGEVRVAASNDIHLRETRRPNKLDLEVDISSSYLLVCECAGFGHGVTGIGIGLVQLVAYIPKRRHLAFWMLLEEYRSEKFGREIGPGQEANTTFIFSTP